MKKKIWMSIVIVAIVAAAFGTSEATMKKYYLSLSGSATGVTTSSKATTGNSPFIVNSRGTASGATVITVDEDTPFVGIQITGVSPSQAGSGAWNYSGTTFYVSYSTAMEAKDLANQEKIPVFYPPVALSGTTTRQYAVRLPYAQKVAFFFHPTGVTDFDGANMEVYVGGKDAGWVKPPAVHLGTLLFNLTATTGTSPFSGTASNGVSMPAGTRYLEAQNSYTSGVTVLYAFDGAAISNDTSQYIMSGTTSDYKRTWSGDLSTLKNISIKALGTTYLNVECWTAKP